jgi:AhpD family alkylhydroperoxidase
LLAYCSTVWDTGNSLSELAQISLRGPSPLSSAEREVIATYVSQRNECFFCTSSHAAVARCLYKDRDFIVDELLADMEKASLDDKMKALLLIAAKVQVSGKEKDRGRNHRYPGETKLNS